MHVHVIDSVLKLNDEVAAINRNQLQDAGVLCLDIIGAPGAGKTALLEATLQHFKGKLRMAVAVGDPATQRDGDRLGKLCDNVIQINTNRGCHLDANHVRQALSKVDVKTVDVLFVENVGNLICPVGFDLGQTVKVGVFSITEGDDKAAKHPYLVREAGLLLLNKVDLLPHLPFNVKQFREDVERIHPGVPLLEVSSTKGGAGFDVWCEWLEKEEARIKAH